MTTQTNSTTSGYNIPSIPASTVAQLGLGAATVLSVMHWWSRKTDHSHSWGLDQLTKMTGLNRRTLIRTLASLEEEGWLKVERAEGRRNVYSIPDHAVPLFLYREDKRGKPLCQTCQAVLKTSDNLSPDQCQSVTTTSDNLSLLPVTDRTTLSSSSEREAESSSPSPPPTPKSQASPVEEKKKKIQPAADGGGGGCPTAGCTCSEETRVEEKYLYIQCVTEGCVAVVDWMDKDGTPRKCLMCELAGVGQVIEDKKVLARKSTRRCQAQGCRYFEEAPGDGFCRKHLRDLAVVR